MDSLALRSIKLQPSLKLWDHEGYPHRPTVQALADRTKQDLGHVYSSMKYLKSIGAFEPGFDPKKPEKSGFCSIIDALRNAGNTQPIEIPPIRRTEASRIVDKAITEHLALIPKEAKHFTKNEVLGIPDAVLVGRTPRHACRKDRRN